MLKNIYDKLYFSRSEIKIIISLFLLFVVGFLTKHFINLRDDEFVAINNPIKDSIFYNSSVPVSQVKLSDPIKNSDTVFIVNLNTASYIELMTLPGIGKITADAIILYRNNRGGFSSVDELLAIKGIGVKKLKKIKHLMKVSE